MALETLKDVTNIGGFDVTRGISNFGPYRPVFINDKMNEIAFKIQNGPVKEAGINGCQVDTLIFAALNIIHGLNSKFPCVHNERAASALADAIKHLHERKLEREARGVEGESKA